LCFVTPPLWNPYFAIQTKIQCNILYTYL
jgi:hypothetical protein